MAQVEVDDEQLDGSTHLLAVSGELDLASTGELRRRVEAALDEGRSRIIVDLDGLTHMDSSGLAELITCHQRAKEMQGGLALVVGSEAIRRTLEIRGVDRLFTVVASRDDALAAFGDR